MTTGKETVNETTKGAMPMTMEKLKVYELAKELGMDSISLLDKLKQLDIDVKSHMSSLGSEEIKLAREHIAKEQALLKKAKTATTKKREAASSSTTTVRRKAGTTVIRRRAKSTEDAEGAPQEMTTATSASEALAKGAEMDASMAAETTGAVDQQTAATEGQQATAGTHAEERAAEATKPAPLQGSGLKFPSLLGARKEGIAPPKSSSILNIVKEEPRKIPPRPPVQPKTATGAGVSRPAPGIVNLGKEAIDRMAEEEQQFKKKSGPGRGERERQPTDVKVSDYRAKKELIFLPKKKKVPLNKEIKKTEITTPAAHKRVIRIENAVSVNELAQRMGIKTGQVMKKLIGMGVMVTVNQPLDVDTATLIASEYGYEVENVAFKEEAVLPTHEDKAEEMQHRPPIVTVMGHVDHGKTSLLDAIRSENVVAGEAGGITQHIGAYTVDLEGKKITFIDTPGHEAFTVMRARGANVTDLVILVVAADDGVMPQTREAVDHARAANVPIIVAVNKVDKPGANPEKVTKGLSEIGILSEEWGGENMFIKVSALKKTGIKELLEAVLLQAEVLDLKANPNRLAEGTVLEARLDRTRGPVVDVIVKKGSLKVGDHIVAGTHCGRVRAMTDDKGRPLKEIGPAYAAEILGLEGVPTAGDTFNTLGSDAEARELAEHRKQKARASEAAKPGKMTLDQLFAKVQTGDIKELPVILKADVFGSAEAVKDSLNKLETEKVKVKVISHSTGGISESDVMLASASNAIILGFNVRPETKARAVAEAEGIEIKCYSIIYELLDDVKKAMAGLLEKKAVENYLGRAEVRDTFSVPKIGTVAGCFVIDGKILRGCQVRLLRDNRVIYTGKLSSLRRFKDDVKEVAQGYECGMGIENFNDIKNGDVIEAFEIEMVAQELGKAISQSEARA